MLPEYRIIGGLVLFVVGAILVVALQHLGEAGNVVLALLGGLVVLYALYAFGRLLYIVALTIYHWGRERMAHPPLMILACLLLAGFATGTWFALQSLLGWENGFLLLLVSVVVAGFAYASLENLVIWVRERTARR